MQILRIQRRIPGQQEHEGIGFGSRDLRGRGGGVAKGTALMIQSGEVTGGNSCNFDEFDPKLA